MHLASRFSTIAWARRATIFGVSACCLFVFAGSSLSADPTPPGSGQAQARSNAVGAADRLKATLVKVYTTAHPADLLSPWQGLGTEKYVGSGVVIAGDRILTNAHLVADSVSIEVKRQGMTRRYEASVAHVGHACDLALLQVDDITFFEGVEPLDLGAMPELQDTVDVYGFPVGGDSISITSGIVSRVEVGRYSHSGVRLLLAQIDAALNPGNSGGPVVADGRIVGVAAQTLGGAENVGYMIPAPVVRHFLADIADGNFDGFPNLGVDLQIVANRGLREELGLAENETGGLVSRINYGSSAWGVLEPGDVLLGVADVEVAEDLTVALADSSSRLAIAWAVGRQQVGEEIELKILRNGEHLTRTISLTHTSALVPGPRYDAKPTYLIFGGMVFQPLTRDYFDFLYEWNHDLAWYAFHQYLRTPERQEVVMLSQVLAAPLNRGYHNWQNEIVATVDGIVPRDMAHLAKLLDAAKGPRLTIMTAEGRRGVLDLERAREITPSILERYGVPSARSPDLRASVRQPPQPQP